MKDIFKQLIIDFHREGVPTPYTRAVDLPTLPANLRKAFVFVGMRRSGKTWALYQLMHRLQEKGTHIRKMVYINFEDDRLDNIELSDLQYLLDAYFELYPNHTEDSDLHFFLDEIHEVLGWEKFVRRILDKEKIQLYITGSSAKQLSKEIASTLRGRSIVREIFPFSFKEYLYLKGIPALEQLTTKEKSQVAHHLVYFLKYGGFPETIDVSDELHRELLQGYMDSVIYRDIVERYQIKQSALLRAFLRFCLKSSASLLSIHKIYQVFKSQGYAVSKDKLYEFMTYFEDAYCLFAVPIFRFSEKKSSSKLKKVYPVDQGLITAFTIKQEYEHGVRLEAAVFSKLRRETEEIYYYQTDSGKEVDFLVKNPNGEVKLYQVCLSLREQKTTEREVNALTESMKTLNLSSGVIVTLEEENRLETAEGPIEAIPAWKFLSKELPV